MRSLARSGVTANQVTVFACGLSLGVAALVWWNGQDTRILYAVPAAMFVRMALNAIDGMLAREHGMKSKLGGILNELTDVVSDSALYLAFVSVPGVPYFTPTLIAVGAALTEMTGVVAVTIGASRRYDGPMGKSDRAFVFGLISLLLAAGVEPGFWMELVFWALPPLLAITVVNRARKALKEAA